MNDSSPTPQDPDERCGVIAVIRQSGSEDSEERFLVIRRSEKVTAPGTYCFPGGGVESGETDAEALPRELKEELSIENPRLIKKIWNSRSRSGVRLAWWIVEIDDAESLIPDPEEVAEVHWWTKTQMRATGKLLDSNELFLAEWENGGLK